MYLKNIASSENNSHVSSLSVSDEENDGDGNKIDNILNKDSINKLLSNKTNNVNLILNLNKNQNNIYNDKSYNDDEKLNTLGNYLYHSKDLDDEDIEDEDIDNEELDDENSEELDDIEETRKKLSKQAAKILFNIINKNNRNLDTEDDDEYEHEDEYEDQDKHNKISRNKKYQPKLENEVMKDEDEVLPPPKSQSNKNYKIFSKILEDDDKESDYFKKNLSLKNQNQAIEKLKTINNLTTIETPYLIHLINLDIPDNFKACALKKINMLRNMGNGFGNSEYYKIKSWVDAFIKIPFNKYNNLSITFVDGIEKCHDFMENAKIVLDSIVYGLEDAKIQIMQLLGLWLVNPNAIGCAIAIKGPMGTGKTTLIKDGISKILNRPFALVALGGCGDSGFLDGHDYTFEGSKYGKIIDILIQSKCMNPIILFDELDKISDTPKGEEIAGVLTHLTDTTQNTHYSDKYMSEINLDMSKALYIFSYNDENRVNPILKDRMYKIETKGYKTNEKLIIAKNYLLPKIQDQTCFKKDEIIIDDDSLKYIITQFTDKEAGVRNLKRSLEIIYTKLNLYRLMKPDVNLFQSTLDLKEKISFPITLTTQHIDKLIIRSHDNIPYGMYN